MSPEQISALEQFYAHDPAARQWRIEHAGRVSLFTFKVVLGLFVGISVVTIIVRLVIRIYIRHKLYIDDYVLLFGLACLTPATYLVFTNAQLVFPHYAIKNSPKVVPTISEVLQLLDTLKTFDSDIALIWTTTFSVKFSFLIFFRQLIDRVSKYITIYYWIVVLFTVASWIFIVCQPFILCPHFDSEAGKCRPAPSDKVSLELSLNTLVTVLDAVSDLLIVSIPIFILRKAKIKVRQKLVMGIFLCLSFAMVVVAMTRISGYRLKTLDLAWQLFWLHMEACIALIMASLTTFRTAFVTMKNENKKKKEKEKKESPSSSIRQRLIARLNRRNNNRSDELETNEDALPVIPGGTLTGMNTFIHRNHRSFEGTCSEHNNNRLEEEEEEGEEEDHHHHHLKEADTNLNPNSNPEKKKNFSIV